MADHIPPDICREIFLRLPAKSLIRLQSVCKSWHAVIDNPSFVKDHMTNKHRLSSNTILIHNSNNPPFYYLDLETLNFTNGLQTIYATPLNFARSRHHSRLRHFTLASCNDLMFVIDPDEEKKWMIWNPLTHERLELPKHDFKSHIIRVGLGYDHATDDYKVVAIDCQYNGRFEEKLCGTHVYSLRSDTWRRITDWPCAEWRTLKRYDPGVFLNGALHWTSRDTIVALDLGDENYRHIKPPPVPSFKGLICGWTLIDVLGGCLSVTDYGSIGIEHVSYHFDLWVMKEYGVQDSWVKLFTVGQKYTIHHLACRLRPVAYMKNEMQILLKDTLGVYLMDVESNSVKNVGIEEGLFFGNLSALVFHGSLFRLHDNCGVSGGDTTGKRIRKLKGAIAMADNKLTFHLTDRTVPKKI